MRSALEARESEDSDRLGDGALQDGRRAGGWRRADHRRVQRRHADCAGSRRSPVARVPVAAERKWYEEEDDENRRSHPAQQLPSEALHRTSGRV